MGGVQAPPVILSSSQCKTSCECGSTLYVGLTGIVRTLIQKSTGMIPPFLRLFFFLKRLNGRLTSGPTPTLYVKNTMAEVSLLKKEKNSFSAIVGFFF